METGVGQKKGKPYFPSLDFFDQKLNTSTSRFSTHAKSGVAASRKPRSHAAEDDKANEADSTESILRASGSNTVFSFANVFMRWCKTGSVCVHSTGALLFDSIANPLPFWSLFCRFRTCAHLLLGLGT